MSYQMCGWLVDSTILFKIRLFPVQEFKGRFESKEDKITFQKTIRKSDFYDKIKHHLEL